MLHLIPRPFHRLALRVAHRLRHIWRKWSGTVLTGVSVIARDPDGRILLVRHSYGPSGWFLPGGGIGGKEKPEAAAHRELREEIDCAIEELALVGVLHEEISGAPHHAHVFEGLIRSTPKPDRREVIEARFFPSDALPAQLSELTLSRLQLWRDHHCKQR